jgi:hypothetical protein
MRNGTPARRAFLLGGAAALAGTFTSAATRRVAAASATEPVSCALVMAVDVSSSIDGEHWWLQRKGYADAFLSDDVLQAIVGTARRKIAVTYFEWSGASNQREIVPWTVVASDEDAGGISDMLRNGRRPFEGATAVGSALDYALAQLASCPFAADQHVIDVSGDGGNNDGPPPEPKRDLAAGQSIRINGLPIDWRGSHPPLGMTIEEYYRASVIGGPNGFCLKAEGFDSFAYAFAAKLRQEVS